MGGLQCAIVGNSGTLLKPPYYGGHIDANDVVLRFNQASGAPHQVPPAALVTPKP